MAGSNDDGLRFTYTFLALLLCSLFLIFLSSTTRLLHATEQIIGLVTHPIHLISNFPSKSIESATLYFGNRHTLLQNMDELRRELLIERSRNATLQYTQDALIELQQMLGSYKDEQSHYQVVEIIGVNPSPQRHQLVVDRGSDGGIEVGMAVVDSQGVIGQVIEVFPDTAIVLTLNDSQHAIPIAVRRSGYRSIATGNGMENFLTLENVPPSADIEVGDELITSGLGGRFPKGYTVGTVHSKTTTDAKTLLRIEVAPAANLFSSRYLLIGSVLEDA